MEQAELNFIGNAYDCCRFCFSHKPQMMSIGAAAKNVNILMWGMVCFFGGNHLVMLQRERVDCTRCSPQSQRELSLKAIKLELIKEVLLILRSMPRFA